MDVPQYPSFFINSFIKDKKDKKAKKSLTYSFDLRYNIRCTIVVTWVFLGQNTVKSRPWGVF